MHTGSVGSSKQSGSTRSMADSAARKYTVWVLAFRYRAGGIGKYGENAGMDLIRSSGIVMRPPSVLLLKFVV